jgi:hypothetical protein
VHQKVTLGIGGRRVLVSRDWSGKTLADHRADAHAWVKALLGGTVDGENQGDTHQPAQAGPVAWEMARHDDPDLPALEHRLLRMISQRIQRRGQLATARHHANGDPPTDRYLGNRRQTRSYPVRTTPRPARTSCGPLRRPRRTCAPRPAPLPVAAPPEGSASPQSGKRLLFDPAEVRAWLSTQKAA